MAPNVYGILVLLGENIKMEIIWIFLGIFNWKKANLAILKKNTNGAQRGVVVKADNVNVFNTQRSILS